MKSKDETQFLIFLIKCIASGLELRFCRFRVWTNGLAFRVDIPGP